MKKHFAAILLVLVLAATASAARIENQNYRFVTVNFPHQPIIFNGPIGINNRGDLAGFYVDGNFKVRGYARINGNFIPVDYPGSTQTWCTTITDNREINGTYFDAEGYQHGFILRNGQYQTIDVPFAARTTGIHFEFGEGLGTAAFGMSDNGAMVGEYSDAAGTGHGWLRVRNQFQTIDFPGAAQFPGGGTNAIAVNNRYDVVGKYWSDAAPYVHGYLWQDGNFTSIDAPNAGGTFGTQANGINNRGDIVGVYTDAGDIYHGFILRDGQYQNIDFPGAAHSECHYINERGDITGTYFDENDVGHGFVAYRTRGGN